MKAPLMIVNPSSGGRRALPGLARLLAATEETLGDVVVHYTAHAGHARDLAAEGTREGHPLVIAVGGDGTLNEVVNGVLSESPEGSTADEGPAVGLINAGTGGDFRRSLGLGADFAQCLAAISLGRERLVDVGQATFTGNDGQTMSHYFVNILSAGVSGLVDHYVAAAPSFLGGPAAYYLSSLRAVALSKRCELVARVSWEEEDRAEEFPAYLVAICNGQWFGGGMHVAPMALIDDGRLEVITVTERNRAQLAAKIRKVYSASHLQMPTVSHFPCTRIKLSLADRTSDRRFLLDVDGEPLGTLPLTVEVLPGRLRVRA